MRALIPSGGILRPRRNFSSECENLGFLNGAGFWGQERRIRPRRTRCCLEQDGNSNRLGADVQSGRDDVQRVLVGESGNEKEVFKTRKTIRCSEKRPDGKVFFEVMIGSMHHVDNGCIAGLIFLPSTFSQSLEFPLFLNSLVSSPIEIAIQRGGLPHALEAIDNLHQKDLQKIFVTQMDDTNSGGEFLLMDEITNELTIVPTTFIQAIAVAIRYQQPLFLEKNVLLNSNADFIDRMFLNPIARDQSGDDAMLADFSKRIKELMNKNAELKNRLQETVSNEEYYEASKIQKEIQSFEETEDLEITKILEDLREFYLNRLSIFFKL